MRITGSHLRRSRPLIAAAAAATLITALVGSSPSAAKSGSSGGSATQLTSLTKGGYLAPAPPKVSPGKPLPKKSGTVPLQADLTVAGSTSSSSTTSAAPLAAGTVAPSTRKVALRALVIAQNPDDFGLATWKATMDRVGASYDVLYTRSQDLTAAGLVRADGTGKYNAVLLTDAMQAYVDPITGFSSALSDTEWNILWAYERDYGVRQAALYASYGAWPEDYCLRQGTEGGTGSSTLSASLTADGAKIFDYLKPSAVVPITESWVYRDTVDTSCGAQPVLMSDSGDVLGVRSVSVDGRDRMALTFTSNENLLQANLLAIGLFRWASKGLYFGEQRHYLELDVDDWFNASDEIDVAATLAADAAGANPDRRISVKPDAFQMTGHDAYNVRTQQNALRAAFPLLSSFMLNAAFNGEGADLTANKTCYPNGGVDKLTATSRCLKADIEWINHTYSHPKMNSTDYATSYAEIDKNRQVASQLGLTSSKQVLKTGEYSGLGVYNTDPTNDIDPPNVDDIYQSNPNLLAAGKALGVKYMHGNMSFTAHQPTCFDCGVIHPMENAITIVPDWPTNVAYFATTPEEETFFYNYFYGPGGKFAFFTQPQTYEQVVANESSQALQQISAGSIYAHTMHIDNLSDYGGGKTLAFDWVNAVAQKFSALYSVPLIDMKWQNLADYVADRNRHFAELGAGVDAVYDPTTAKITVVSPAAGKVTVSGANKGGGATTYGSDTSTALTLKGGRAVAVPAVLLP